MKTIEKTAAQAYNEYRNDIARLIDVLEMELQKYDAKFEADRGRWDRVGSLGHARGRIMEAVQAVSGIEIEQIEEFLSE